MPAYVETLKLVAIAFLLYTTLKLVIQGRFSSRGNAIALFTFSIAGYLGCQLCHAFKVEHWLSNLIHVGCFMVPWAFYVLAEALFEDNFRFRWMHLAGFIFIEAVHFYLVKILRVYDVELYREHEAYFNFLRAVPQTVSLVYILAALYRTLSRRRIDLIEERRRFRLQFIFTNSAYMIVVIVSELALHGRKAPDLIEGVHAIGILATVLFFTWRIFAVRDNILGGFAGPPRKNSGAENIPVDGELLQKLQTAMQQEKIYTQESLSISALAKHLEVHEYLLRRLINTGLGYRNFNDYLNELRIKEACRILEDPEQTATPIIRIAMDLGFGSLAPFNRAFKERTQKTPTEYRRTR